LEVGPVIDAVWDPTLTGGASQFGRAYSSDEDGDGPGGFSGDSHGWVALMGGGRWEV